MRAYLDRWKHANSCLNKFLITPRYWFVPGFPTRDHPAFVRNTHLTIEKGDTYNARSIIALA
jgi:hypothetical protein